MKKAQPSEDPLERRTKTSLSSTPMDNAASATADPNAPTQIAVAENDPLVEREFDGYRIRRQIGRGGMGVVYKATQLSLDRPVAIKVLPHDLLERPQFRERFHREIDVLSKLSHPNIVTVFDRGEIDGQPYVVMEYVEGTSLREMVKKGPLALSKTLGIARSVLAGLAHAHNNGIIHRDLKPENVLVGPGDVAKVADFGLSRVVVAEDLTRLTRTQFVLGTYEYMAPEQRESARTADERSDLYAVGVLLYEMLTGELPIGRFELPSRRRPNDCDDRIDRLIELCLEKDPARRVQKARQVAEAVTGILRGQSLPSARPGSPAAAGVPAWLWSRFSRADVASASLILFIGFALAGLVGFVVTGAGAIPVCLFGGVLAMILVGHFLVESKTKGLPEASRCRRCRVKAPVLLTEALEVGPGGRCLDCWKPRTAATSKAKVAAVRAIGKEVDSFIAGTWEASSTLPQLDKRRAKTASAISRFVQDHGLPPELLRSLEVQLTEVLYNKAVRRKQHGWAASFAKKHNL